MAISPIACGYVLHAYQTAPDRSWASVAGGLASLDLLAWCFLQFESPFFLLVGILFGLMFVLRRTLQDHLG
jgi:hypothetical protein